MKEKDTLHPLHVAELCPNPYEPQKSKTAEGGPFYAMNLLFVRVTAFKGLSFPRSSREFREINRIYFQSK